MQVRFTEIGESDKARATETNRSPDPTQKSYRVIFIAGDERDGHADSLLCRAGELTPNMQLLLVTARNEFVVRINRIIDGTGDWQRIGFQVTEKRALSPARSA